ncbi:recombinase family protein [Gordonia sputi]|uniref:recombinase family protein n=1 Tax=Gordonia sputi TaxID=36823 RepID=UPI0022706196|nr:recombinase family protein [Gordonia sputi]
MTARAIGYARVSTTGQDYDRQVIDLKAAGIRVSDIYSDKASGSRTSRPGLDAALAVLEPGDTLVVTTLDRLGRSTTHVLELADDLRERGVNLRVLNLGGEAVDSGTPTGKLLLTMLAALAEMERSIKVERIRDSVAKRRASGGDLGGRPAAISDDVLHGIERDIAGGVSASEACRKRGVSRATFYRHRAMSS